MAASGGIQELGEPLWEAIEGSGKIPLVALKAIQ